MDLLNLSYVKDIDELDLKVSKSPEKRITAAISYSISCFCGPLFTPDILKKRYPNHHVILYIDCGPWEGYALGCLRYGIKHLIIDRPMSQVIGLQKHYDGHVIIRNS